MKLIRVLILFLSGIVLMISCSKSPEDKIMELAPRFQKALCSKMIECSKDDIAKIPPQYRATLPAFMQSEEGCVTYFKENFDKAREQRKSQKRELTAETVASFEACIAGLETTTCEPFKARGGQKLGVPGCENLEKISKPESP
ncbi:LA_2478/LA_2722/LA_4182 family protein [Leptospira neocaledonica]|uniref:Lipoprotein n=1 Tax=Leptospira neocaledonica TaxID=2023192 RepID=A0A2M9ZY72_9LEPT|nr:hypothetical protein [Leptospira neocaledonica]PJZ77032.1 hypothetical protein CH365_09740 [Leptospira neocaledonica]